MNTFKRAKVIYSSSSAFLKIMLVTVLLPNALGIGLPLPSPIGGESSSLDEAVRLTENTGFTIKLPVDTPSGLRLTDIRLMGVGPLDLQRPWIEGVSEILLIFSEETIPENMTLPELTVSGGIMAIEKKKDPRNVRVIEELLEAGGRKGPLTLVEIDGVLGYYIGEDEIQPWRSELTWIDDETFIEMLASPEHYSQNDLVGFAESFTDWSAIKTTTVTVTSTVTIATVSATTSTLTTVLNDSSIYAWAISATFTVIILASVLILRHRKRSA